MDADLKWMVGAGFLVAGLLVYRGLTRPEPPPDNGGTWTDAMMERQVMAWKDSIWLHGLANRTDPALIAAIMAQESSGINALPRLVEVENGKFDWVVGLMQVRLQTAGIVCDKWHEYELKDPETNIDCGVKYLRKMLDRFSGKASAISAYQMGPGGVYEDSMVGGGMRYANPQYISNVLNMARRFRVLFVTWRPADYLRGFPRSEWDYAAELAAVL